jgi:hypothetical protein
VQGAVRLVGPALAGRVELRDLKPDGASLRGRSWRAGLDVDWLRREILSDRALIAAAAARDPRPPALQAFLVRVGPTLQRWAGQVAPADQERQFQLLADFIVSTAMAEGMRVAFASP